MYVDNWNKFCITDCLQMMSGSGFLSGLMQFQKDTINEETIELLDPYLRMEDYNMASAKKVCGDVAGLAAWTRAMAIFYSVNKEVLPLKVGLLCCVAFSCTLNPYGMISVSFQINIIIYTTLYKKVPFV